MGNYFFRVLGKKYIRRKKWKEDLADSGREMTDQERCTRLYAQNARKNAKFPSNQKATDQFTAKSAMQRKTRDQEDFDNS